MADWIPLTVPCFRGNESAYLQECLDTNFVSSSGPAVEEFEKEFAEFVGAKFAVACNSGSAALHIALRVAGANAGLEVAVSSFTFIASVNAAAYCQSSPLLVDSEWETWNLDSNRLYDEVTRRAKAGKPLPAVIEPVHILGHPVDLEPLLDLRQKFGIPIVEDAAEALGATYNADALAGKGVGTIGDLGCFSFNGNKIITTGGGGMIVTGDKALARRARHLTVQAKSPGIEYVHDQVGYNYRMTNLAASLGRAQLELLPDFLVAKRKIADRYVEGLTGLPIEFPPLAPWANPSNWLFSVLLGEGCPPKEFVVDELRARGIESRPLWLPAHLQSPYLGANRLGGDVAEALHVRGISLPSSVGLDPADQERVIETLQEILGRP